MKTLLACAALGLAALTAACTPGAGPGAFGPGAFGPANPDRVTILSDTLSVHFYDGSLCRADLKLALSGSFADCPQAMDYAVTLHQPTWVKGAEALFQPYATITLTAARGRTWVFRTPDGAADREGDLDGGVVQHY